MKKVFFMAVFFSIAISNSATSPSVAKAKHRNTVNSYLFTNPWIGVKSLKKEPEYTTIEVYTLCGIGYEISNITIGTDTHSLYGQFPIQSCSHKTFITDEIYGGTMWIYIPYVYDPTANHLLLAFDDDGMETIPVGSGGVYSFSYISTTPGGSTTIYAL